MRIESTRAETTKSYIYGLTSLSVVFLVLWISSIESLGFYFDWTALFGSAALASLCALARRFPVRLRRGTVEVADIAFFCALILFGPLWAILVAIPDFVYRDRLRTAFASSADILSLLAMGYVFHIFSAPLLVEGAFSSNFVYGVVASCVTFYLVEIAVNSVLVRLKYGTPISENLKDVFLPVIPSDILAILAALGTAYVMVAFGPAAALVLFLGGAGAIVSLHLIYTRHRENESLKDENAALLSANVRFAASLVRSLDEKAPHVSRISSATSVYAGDIGAEFGFDRNRLDLLRIAALLQDIGLASVPDGVLLASPDHLNPEGRRELEHHPVVGEEILASVSGFEEAAKWVRWHHERTDGSGYPDAMQGRWLPLEARILAVAETYASLVLESPGNPPITAEEARFSLTDATDSTLDAEVVKALLRLLDREVADYATASGERFSFGRQAEESVGKIPSLRVVGD